MTKKELSAYFKKMGQKGGKATKAKYGKEHFAAIGKMPKITYTSPTK